MAGSSGRAQCIGLHGRDSMYRRKLRARQMAALCAVLFAAGALQWTLQHTIRKDGSAFLPTLTSLVLYWQTGRYGQLPDAAQEETALPAVQAPDEPETDPAPETQENTAPAPETPDEPTQVETGAAALQFSAQEADEIRIAGACSYPVDEAALLQQPLQLGLAQDAPQVLIVHTHTTEAYAKEAGQSYDTLVNARTLDEQYNMIRVGDAVAEVLRQNGIQVIHDTTVNDYPSYNGAYDRMKAIIEADLAQYPSIRMVLDIHRDAAADANGDPLPLTATFSGEDYAQVMLVVGTDEGGLPHPNWQQNLSCALKLQALMNRDWPGLCRDLDLRRERFNQNQTPGSLLVEFGTDGNTLSQALRSAEVFGQSLSQLLQAQLAGE